MPIAVSSGFFVRFQTTPMHSADVMLNRITPRIVIHTQKIAQANTTKSSMCYSAAYEYNSLHNYVDSDNTLCGAG